jgi:hypothetical protein
MRASFPRMGNEITCRWRTSKLAIGRDHASGAMGRPSFRVPMRLGAQKNPPLGSGFLRSRRRSGYPSAIGNPIEKKAESKCKAKDNRFGRTGIDSDGRRDKSKEIAEEIKRTQICHSD